MRLAPNYAETYWTYDATEYARDFEPEARTVESTRQTVRTMIKSGRSMDDAERLFRQGIITQTALERFERIFAWATAIDHPLTRNVPLPRWQARRERIR